MSESKIQNQENHPLQNDQNKEIEESIQSMKAQINEYEIQFER